MEEWQQNHKYAKLFEAQEAEYIPFGAEWEGEMNKFPKAQLIRMLAAAHKKRQLLAQSLLNYTTVVEQFLENMPDDAYVDMISASVMREAHENALNALKLK